MLKNNFGVTLDLNQVYRMMDDINEGVIGHLNTLAYTTTRKLFNDKIDVIYFDATTLYFEGFTKDEGGCPQEERLLQRLEVQSAPGGLGPDGNQGEIADRV